MLLAAQVYRCLLRCKLIHQARSYPLKPIPPEDNTLLRCCLLINLESLINLGAVGPLQAHQAQKFLQAQHCYKSICEGWQLLPAFLVACLGVG